MKSMVWLKMPKENAEADKNVVKVDLRNEADSLVFPSEKNNY